MGIIYYCFIRSQGLKELVPYCYGGGGGGGARGTFLSHGLIHYIHKFLNVETATLFANSMISSRLDYCYSLLYSVSKYNVAKLQKIQNALCRIVFRLDKTSHITQFLQKLHWLLISYHILFKYNLITFKAIKFSQPTHLSSLMKTSSLTHGNWLSLSSVCPRKAIAGQGLQWLPPLNRLPQLVRAQHTVTGFRSQLKTYLFRLAYPPPYYVSLGGHFIGSRPDTSLNLLFLTLSASEDVGLILRNINVAIFSIPEYHSGHPG